MPTQVQSDMNGKPHIVWTFRRTGGTTLASLLASLSPYPTVEHEPFNHGRVFGDVADAYEDGRLEEYERGIREIVGRKYVIKNCFDVRTLDFNLDIAARFSEGDAYKHVVLIRRAENKRLLSLAVALETGAWGPRQADAVIERLRTNSHRRIKLNIPRFQIEHLRCQERLLELERLFERGSIARKVIYFEDIYAGERTKRIAKLEEVLDFLGFDDVTQDSLEALFTKAQRSNEIYDYVSNLDEFLTQVTQPPSALSKLVHRLETNLQRTRSWIYTRLGAIRRRVG